MCVASLWFTQNIMFITLGELDPPLLLAAHTSAAFLKPYTHTCKNRNTNAQFDRLSFIIHAQFLQDVKSFSSDSLQLSSGEQGV